MEYCIEALTPEVIKQQSGAAIATTLGILTDKRQLLTGGFTDNVQIKVSTKDSALKALQDGRKHQLNQLEGNTETTKALTNQCESIDKKT